jgi:hypothetical protein
MVVSERVKKCLIVGALALSAGFGVRIAQLQRTPVYSQLSRPAQEQVQRDHERFQAIYANAVNALEQGDIELADRELNNAYAVLGKLYGIDPKFKEIDQKFGAGSLWVYGTDIGRFRHCMSRVKDIDARVQKYRGTVLEKIADYRSGNKLDLRDRVFGDNFDIVDKRSAIVFGHIGREIRQLNQEIAAQVHDPQARKALFNSLTSIITMLIDTTVKVQAFRHEIGADKGFGDLSTLIRDYTLLLQETQTLAARQ